MSRTYTLTLSKIVSGIKQPDTGRTVTIRDLAGSTLGTATESPANSGMYSVSLAEVSKYGYWYVDGSIQAGYSNNSPFWVGLYDSLSGVHYGDGSHLTGIAGGGSGDVIATLSGDGGVSINTDSGSNLIRVTIPVGDFGAYVPYTGATQGVNFGAYVLTAFGGVFLITKTGAAIVENDLYAGGVTADALCGTIKMANGQPTAGSQGVPLIVAAGQSTLANAGFSSSAINTAGLYRYTLHLWSAQFALTENYQGGVNYTYNNKGTDTISACSGVAMTTGGSNSNEFVKTFYHTGEGSVYLWVNFSPAGADRIGYSYTLERLQ